MLAGSVIPTSRLDVGIAAMFFYLTFSKSLRAPLLFENPPIKLLAADIEFFPYFLGSDLPGSNQPPDEILRRSVCADAPEIFHRGHNVEQPAVVRHNGP